VINRKKTDGLVPYADMLNHRRPRETKWTFDDVRYGFVITTLKDVGAGAQLYDSYGRKVSTHSPFTHSPFKHALPPPCMTRTEARQARTASRAIFLSIFSLTLAYFLSFSLTLLHTQTTQQTLTLLSCSSSLFLFLSRSLSSSYKCNSRFFVNYGFSLPDNEDNEAVVRVSLKSKDPVSVLSF
jgi:hypothetical protein